MVEGARLESVCTGNCTEGSNPSLSAINLSKAIFKVGLRWVGSCAIGTHEPRQVRKEATVSDNSYVPRGCLIYRGPTLEMADELKSSWKNPAAFYFAKML